MSLLFTLWPTYWNFSFSISPSNDYSGLISFRIDWFDLLAIQETLKSLLQHHNSKASIFGYSACLMEKEKATHSSVLGWRIPGTTESGGLPSMGSHRVRHDWCNLAAAAAAAAAAFLMAQFSHPYIYWKNHSFDYRPLLAKWCLCLLINCVVLSYLSFHGKRRILISGLQSVTRPYKNDNRVSSVGENRKEFGKGILVLGKEVKINEKH